MWRDRIWLSIEHIRGKGHKLIYDSTYNLLRKLKDLGWPEGYKILCMNCNWYTRFGKMCPHRRVNKEVNKNAVTYDYIGFECNNIWGLSKQEINNNVLIN